MTTVSGIRSKASSSLIIALIIAIYIFSPLPFLFTGEQDGKTIFRYYQYATPVMVGGLIVLLLLKANRQKSATGEEKTAQERIRASRRRMIKVGALAGFTASLLVSLLIGLSELVMGLPSGMYFSVLGTVIGITTLGTAEYGIYLGWIAHLLTGSAIGAIFGAMMVMLPVCDVKNKAQTIVYGLLAGFLAFIVLFNPISRLGIEPGLVETLTVVMSDYSSVLIKNTVNEIMSTLLAGSIIMHLVYGAILGIAVHLLGRRIV